VTGFKTRIVYHPERGDVVMVSFDPTIGTEQAGHRPALVLTPRIFNTRTHFAWVCPITNTDRKNNMHVPVGEIHPDITGYVLTEQIRALDYEARGAIRRAVLPETVLDEVLARIASILELPDT
jgi:mRNA interferase MazF